MKNKKKILIGIVLLLLLVGVIVGVYFFVLKKEDKLTKTEEEYGIKESYVVREDVNYLSKYNYTVNKNENTFVYDLSNKELLSFESNQYYVELDNKYILVHKVDGEMYAIYDTKGKELYKNNSIKEISSNEDRYFIIDNKVYNYDLNELFELNKDISVSSYIGINGYLLYTISANKNTCVDLSNGKMVINGYDDVIATGDYVLFRKDGKYHMYEKNKEIATYDKVEHLSFYYDFIAFDEHTLLLKLFNGDKVEYLIEGEIVSEPELNLNEYVVDLGMCSSGGKIKKDNKLISDDCLYDVFTSKNVVVGIDSNTEKSKLYVNGQDMTKDNAQYNLVGDYVIETDIDTGNDTIYDNEGKKVGEFYLLKYNNLYVKNSFSQYFLNEKLEEISPGYAGIYCNSVNNFCVVRNEDGNYALFYKDKKLTEFNYSGIELGDETIVMNDGIFNQILILDKNVKNKNVPDTKYEEINKIDIKRIKEENNLDFEIPSEYEQFFKKYAYVVENNKNILNYKYYVYEMFQILMNQKINSYINKPYFLSRLKQLSIKENKKIANNGVDGYYYDASTSIELVEEYSLSIYHELVHFLDFSINKDDIYLAWLCNNKLVDEKDYYNLSKDNRKLCSRIDVSSFTSDIMVEAGAELYSAKYFKKGIKSYYDITAYITGLEYILGSEKLDELFFAKNTSYNFMKLFVNNGYAIEKFKKLNADLSGYTYPFRNMKYEFEKNAVDSLIDLYKIYKKDKNWLEDEEFKYIINSFIGIDGSINYKNSKYKDDLSKIDYKSFNSYKKQENEILKDLPDKIDLGVSPIPPFIINNQLYLGTSYNLNQREFAYLKYDFYNKKIIDYKYPITIR